MMTILIKWVLMRFIYNILARLVRQDFHFSYTILNENAQCKQILQKVYLFYNMLCSFLNVFSMFVSLAC